MKKVIASLSIIFFFGAAHAQGLIKNEDQTNLSSPESTSESSTITPEFIVQPTDLSVVPDFGLLCRDIITNYDVDNTGLYAGGAATLGMFGAYSIMDPQSREPGVPNQDFRPVWITTYAIAFTSAAHYLIRNSSMTNLQTVVEQSLLCDQKKLCASEHLEKYAERVIPTSDLDIEKFSKTVTNNTHSFCKTTKRGDGRFSMRIKSAHAIKRIIHDRYFLTN